MEISVEQLSEPILAFYSGELPDSEGRMIHHIWAWDDESLESVHDYVQWLFPLKKRSGFNPNAPLLNDRVIEAFTTNDSLRVRLTKSLNRMLAFYGLECIEHLDGSIEISESAEYERRKSNWIGKYNHNYLRLTRVLISLGLLGLDNHARALFKCLDGIYKHESDSIGAATHAYWENAVSKKNA